MKILLCTGLSIITFALHAQMNAKIQAKLDQQANAIESRVIEWRRYFHEHPELSNREMNTAAKVAEHLKSLGIAGHLACRSPIARR